MGTDSLLQMHLQAFVPLEIAVLQRVGGIDRWHIEEAQRRMQALREPGHSEALFAIEQGKSGQAMGVLVECLAVLAFVPGGISAFGCHFEAQPSPQTEKSCTEDQL